MKERIKLLSDFLQSQTAFTNVVGTRLYPLVAKEGAAMPFAVYNVGSDTLTKDGRTYNAAVQLFFSSNDFTEMVTFADVVAELFIEYDNIDLGEITTDYNPDYKMIYTTILFNID